MAKLDSYTKEKERLKENILLLAGMIPLHLFPDAKRKDFYNIVQNSAVLRMSHFDLVLFLSWLKIEIRFKFWSNMREYGPEYIDKFFSPHEVQEADLRLKCYKSVKLTSRLSETTLSHTYINEKIKRIQEMYNEVDIAYKNYEATEKFSLLYDELTSYRKK